MDRYGSQRSAMFSICSGEGRSRSPYNTCIPCATRTIQPFPVCRPETCHAHRQLCTLCPCQALCGNVYVRACVCTQGLTFLTPRSPTGKTFCLPSLNIHSMSTVHGPTPFTCGAHTQRVSQACMHAWKHPSRPVHMRGVLLQAQGAVVTLSRPMKVWAVASRSTCVRISFSDSSGRRCAHTHTHTQRQTTHAHTHTHTHTCSAHLAPHSHILICNASVTQRAQSM
jgi:hypothetical protein